MRASALLVSVPVHVALAFWQRVEDDEVKLDLLFAVLVEGFEDVGAGVGHLCAVDDQGRGGATLIFVVQNAPLFAVPHRAFLGVSPFESRRRFCEKMKIKLRLLFSCFRFRSILTAFAFDLPNGSAICLDCFRSSLALVDLRGN